MARINLINGMTGVSFRTGINDNFIEVYNKLSATEIKSVYESNSDTNEFTDAEKTKLGNITESTELTDEEIKIAYENNADTNAFTDSEKTQLATNTDNVNQLVAIHNTTVDPAGYDLRNVKSKGIIELCKDSASGEFERFDENDNWSKITGATYFGDGVTLLADKTFVQYPVPGESEFYFWNRGKKFTKTTTQILTLFNVSDKQIISYDENGDIGFSQGLNDAISEDTITALVTGHPLLQKKVIFGNERHGMEMSNATHLYLHETEGVKYSSGLNINGLVNNGTSYTDIEAGSIWDEDIKININSMTTSVFAYRDGVGGDWTISDNKDTLLGLKNGSSQVVYNLYDEPTDTWSLEPIDSNYIIMHFFATNDGENQIFKVLGQFPYVDRGTARDNLNGDVSRMLEGNLPTPEFLHLYSMIIHNESNGQIETGTTGEIYIDYRKGFPVERF